MLSHLESARDFINGILSNPAPGRSVLVEIFGGDCGRIARLHAILDDRTWSDRNAMDQRISTTRSVVQSAGMKLVDLGHGGQLALAMAREKEELLIRRRSSIPNTGEVGDIVRYKVHMRIRESIKFPFEQSAAKWVG